MEYSNLRIKLFEKKIDLKLVAECLGVDEKTVRNKINGKNKTGFSYDEADKIKKIFLSEYDKEFLFTRESKSSLQPTG